MALQVWLPLNGDLHNQGLNNITITNSGATVNNNGKVGKCYSFGTTTSYIDIQKEAMTSFTTEASVCFWLKILTWNTSYATYFQAGATNASWAHYTFGLLRNNANSTCCFTISNGSTASNANYLTPTLELNTWYHIGLCYKTGHCLIYINGQLYQDYSTSIVPNFSGIARISLGVSNNRSGYQSNCLMNDVRIYDHCLSAKEIKKISQALILHYPLNNSNNILTKYDKQIYTEPDNSQWLHIAKHNNPGSSGYFTKTASWETGVYLDSNRWYDVSVVNLLSNFEFMVKQAATSTATETKYRWIQNINPLQAVYNDVKPASVTRITTTGYTDGTFGGLWKMNGNARLCIANATASNWYGAIGSWTAYQNGIPGYPNTTITSGYIDLYVRIDNQFNLIYDSSGYNNNIYSNGSKPIITMENSIKYKNYSNFFSGGRLATIVAASTFMPKDMITVSIWIKTNAASNRFLSCTESGGFNFEPASGAVSLPLYISGKGYTRVNGTTTWTDLSDNNWHMITATYDRLNTKLYIDGNLDTSTASSYPNIDIGYNSSTPFTLGAEAQTIASPIAGTYVGGLSDCRIYATALSADDIKELYRTSKIVSGTAVSPRSLE